MRKPVNWDFIKDLYESDKCPVYKIVDEYARHHKNSKVYKETVSLVGINKKRKQEKWTPPDTRRKLENKLTVRQERFCKIYATDEEFFCNGTRSYIEAFSIDKKAITTAQANAWKLLKNPLILKRIDELLELGGLNDTTVDKQLQKLIIQDADLKTKLGAIKEYNILKARIKKGLELTGKDGKDLIPKEFIKKELKDRIKDILDNMNDDS